MVLAAGRGTRMQRADGAASLDAGQAAAADRGLKVMIPDGAGRPFLDHVLSSLADAGVHDVALVVPPSHDAIAGHLAAHPPMRVRTALVVQEVPTGTAHAIAACEAWVGARPFLSLNADNLYPVAVLDALVASDGPACAAFDADALVTASNFTADRVSAFALLDVADGQVRRVVEKPSGAERASLAGAPVSMNVWRFDDRIFAACRSVPPSARGEHELPQAVDLAIRGGMPLAAIPVKGGVVDLSSRGDVEGVARHLATMTPRP